MRRRKFFFLLVFFHGDIKIVIFKRLYCKGVQVKKTEATERRPGWLK